MTTVSGEHAALGVEPRVHFGREFAGLPQDVSARERRVTAQIDFDGRREPSQVKGAVRPGDEERRFGQVHLGGNGLHPVGVAGGGENANARRVAGEWVAGEGVHGVDG